MLVGIHGKPQAGKDTIADYLARVYGYTRIGITDPHKEFASKVFGFSQEQLYGPSGFRNGLDLRYSYFIRQPLGVPKTYDELQKLCQRLTNHPNFDGGWRQAIFNLRDFAPSWVHNVSSLDHLDALVVWFFEVRKLYPGISPRIVLQSLGTDWGRTHCGESVWVDCFLKSVESSSTNRIVCPDVRFPNEMAAISAIGGKLFRVHRASTDGLASSVGLKNHQTEAALDLPAYDAVLNNEGGLEDLYRQVDSAMEKCRG